MEECTRCGWRCTIPCPEYCPVCGVQLLTPSDSSSGKSRGQSHAPIILSKPSDVSANSTTKITYQFGLGHGITRGVTIIAAISIVLFFIAQMNPQFFNPLLGFVPSHAVGKFMVWQFLTANFMHGDITHFFMNMFALLTFGGAVEKIFSEKEFLKYFLFCGVSAYVFTFVLWIAGVIPNNLCLGASAGIYGLLLAFSLFYPNQKMLLFFAIPMEAKWLALLFGGIEFVLSLYNSGASHFGHLGGLLAGILYLFVFRRDFKNSCLAQCKGVA